MERPGNCNHQEAEIWEMEQLKSMSKVWTCDYQPQQSAGLHMVYKAMGKSLEQLQMERTVAKMHFSHLVDSISWTYKILSEDELRDLFNRLKAEAEKVMEANERVEAGLLAELQVELDSGEVELTKQQKADLTQTANECELKLNEVKSLIRETLWVNFGSCKVSAALRLAVLGFEHTAATQFSGKETCEFMLKHLQGLIKTAKEIYVSWKRWMPQEDQESIQSTLGRLELLIPKLIYGKADVKPPTTREDSGRRAHGEVSSAYATPNIKVKPTALPKCNGTRWDLHGCKQDWEPVREQSKSDTSPTGCVVCGNAKHKKKLFFCKQFRALELTERKAAVTKLGACTKCLEVHSNSPFSCKLAYLCKSEDCTDDHHFYLCPTAELCKGGEHQRNGRSDPEGLEGTVVRRPSPTMLTCWSQMLTSEFKAWQIFDTPAEQPKHHRVPGVTNFNN